MPMSQNQRNRITHAATPIPPGRTRSLLDRVHLRRCHWDQLENSHHTPTEKRRFMRNKQLTGANILRECSALHSTVTFNRLCCPQCGSTQIKHADRGERICATIGAIAGATRGVSKALAIPAWGLVARENHSTRSGRAARAVLCALLDGATGCTAGAMLGAKVDQFILKNCMCLTCQHTFR